MLPARPQSTLALALATLAVGFAAWWAVDTYVTLEPGPDEDVQAVSLLPGAAEEPTLPPPPVAEPRRVEPPAPPPVRRPPLNPPGLVAPPRRTVATAAETAEGADGPPPAAELVEPQTPGTAPRTSGRARTWTLPWLTGGGGGANARATAEVAVDEVRAWIGSPADWVARLAAQRRAVPYVALPMEAPRHQVTLEPYFFDRVEVSNHAYWGFLEATASILYRTSDQPPRTLEQIAASLIVDPPDNLDLAGDTGRQLFHANSAALLAAFRSHVVLNDNATVDLARTYQAIRGRIVPRGVDLRFYDRAPPRTWWSHEPTRRQYDHPVRDTSVQDAIAYAMYRGRFVPSEQQWEVAARGPKGLDWPWGGDGSLFDSSVNGGQAREPGQRPQTVPVTNQVGGLSWIGAFHLTGNVSEWTSSFLDPYPGGASTVPGPPEAYVVVRGGSARDEDRTVMRPAFRGWLADDPEGAPGVNRRRAWTGIRTARRGSTDRVDAVHGRIPTMHFRARVARRIVPEALQVEVFAGFEGLQVQRFERIAGESEAEARAKPRPGVKTVVVSPFTTICLASRGRWRPNADPDLTSVEALLAQPAPVLYGLLHTDVHLLDAWHAYDDGAPAGIVPERMRREDVPPGTYFLASIQGVLALLPTDFGDTWFLSNRPATAASLSVIPRDYRATSVRPAVESFRLRGLERLETRLQVPMHPGTEDGAAARLVLRLAPDGRETGLLVEVEQRLESR